MEFSYLYWSKKLQRIQQKFLYLFSKRFFSPDSKGYGRNHQRRHPVVLHKLNTDNNNSNNNNNNNNNTSFSPSCIIKTIFAFIKRQFFYNIKLCLRKLSLLFSCSQAHDLHLLHLRMLRDRTHKIVEIFVIFFFLSFFLTF